MPAKPKWNKQGSNAAQLYVQRMKQEPIKREALGPMRPLVLDTATQKAFERAADWHNFRSNGR